MDCAFCVARKDPRFSSGQGTAPARWRAGGAGRARGSRARAWCWPPHRTISRACRRHRARHQVEGVCAALAAAARSRAWCGMGAAPGRAWRRGFGRRNPIESACVVPPATPDRRCARVYPCNCRCGKCGSAESEHPCGLAAGGKCGTQCGRCGKSGGVASAGIRLSIRERRTSSSGDVQAPVRGAKIDRP